MANSIDHETNEEGPSSASSSERGDLDFSSQVDKVDHEVEADDDAENGHISRPWDPNLIRVDPKPFSIQQVLDMIDDGDLILQPEFQRRRVWNRQQKSLLIESLLLRIPLPTFYFAADENDQLQVIDGLQRLSTIHDFVRGGSDGTRYFRLSNLEYLQHLVGTKTFADLTGQVWARRILQASITANIVDPQTPTQVKLNIFSRLNRQGTPLSQQELRHAMSGNRSRQFLLELAANENFHEATRNALRDSKRMHDIEMALRFCSFQNGYQFYDQYGSLSELLTTTTSWLDDVSRCPDETLEVIRAGFDLAMRNAITVFGGSAFRKYHGSPVNRPLYEVWSYVLSRISQESVSAHAELLRSIQKQIMLDPYFQESISLNTGDPRKVGYRFRALIGALSNGGLTVE